LEILDRFQDSLSTLLKNQEGEMDHYFGMPVWTFYDVSLTMTGISLREMIHDFKWQTLVLFKSALLQPKVCTISLLGVYHADLVDALLRFPLRAAVHDAVCSYFIDTRPYSPSSRFS
jgi:hypothetical protein